MSTSGLSASRLEQRRRILADYVERGALPGLIALVSRHSETHIEIVGAASFNGAPMQRDTIFRISSMSKPIVAVAAMILVEECVLRLDDPVDRWLPELADRRVVKRLDGPLDDTVPAKRPISVRDLLDFRMGFGQLMAEPDAYPILKAAYEQGTGVGPPGPAATPAPDEWLRRFSALPLMAQPGERWIYNTAADVLGILIARATAQPLETFLRERIFAPLDMHDTSFNVPPDKIERFVTGYMPNSDSTSTVFDEAAGGQWSQPPAFPSGAGGLVSTVDDFLAFGQMMLNKGRHNDTRILSRPTMELMTTNQLTPEQQAGADFLGANRGWGFGLSVVTKRDELSAVPGRFGWEGGLGTSWASDPHEDMVGILMTQAAWSTPSGPQLWNDFWTTTYAAIDD